MKEYKWSVGLRHKATRERLNVTVWAPKNEDATHKLCGILIGPECEYEWTGTGPVYENNQTVSREAQTAQVSEVAYPIPQHHLTAAVEGLQNLVRRMEADAAAFSMIATREGALREVDIDLVQVVRCKDCKHLYFKDFSAFCPHRVSACMPEGFCEYGGALQAGRGTP